MTSKLNFDSNNFKEMFHYIHKNGNIYDGLAYLYSICKEDNELNKYIMTQINYDTNNNSLNSAKLHSMNMIARNNFEKKYKELLGEYTMFTVEKKLLELEENETEKYYDLKYNKETKEFELDIDEDKIDNFFIVYRCYPQNVMKKIEKRLFEEYQIPITVGDENIEQIQKELGTLGTTIYLKYYDWYKENGQYEFFDYIDFFCYVNIDNIKDILDEVITYTETDDEIEIQDKGGIIMQAEELKEKLDKLQKERSISKEKSGEEL